METHATRPSPGALPRPDYLPPDGTLQVPQPGESLEERGARELQQSQRNSDVRGNLLRQQIHQDLQLGIHGPPPLPGRPQPPGAGRSWP
ncbi:MAG: hypothetical protein ACWA5A_03845 [Marinibacterium sp.]